MMAKFQQKYGLGEWDFIQTKVIKEAKINKRWKTLVKGLDKRYRFIPHAIDTIGSKPVK